MSLAGELVAAIVCPVTRRVEFRGKRRLRLLLPLPESGTREVRFPGGFRLALDLSESLQRDFLFGLTDRYELKLAGALLARGGDFVDVGAHVGLYSVFAGRRLLGRNRVLAFEPNPATRGQFERNLRLNGVENVELVAAAASAVTGTASLHVPLDGDPSWARLDSGDFVEGEPVEVPMSTVDAEVAARGLEPALIKVDVEGHELEVLAGMSRTLQAHRPALLIELGPHSSAEVEKTFEDRGYRVFAIERNRLRPAPLPHAPGPFNVLLVPAEKLSLLEG